MINTVYIGTDTHVYVDVNGITIKVLEQNQISRLDPKAYYTVGRDYRCDHLPENTLVLLKNEASMLQAIA